MVFSPIDRISKSNNNGLIKIVACSVALGGALLASGIIEHYLDKTYDLIEGYSQPLNNKSCSLNNTNNYK